MSSNYNGFRWYVELEHLWYSTGNGDHYEGGVAADVHAVHSHSPIHIWAWKFMEGFK